MRSRRSEEKFRGAFGAAVLLTKASASALFQEMKELDYVSLNFEQLGSGGGLSSRHAHATTHVRRKVLQTLD